jgi:hypothetical protein
MPHLLAPRKGWENERLASYLLSRFSFVAQPSTIADDLGSDFFCTMFEIVPGTSGMDSLRPLSSFAIQVKSSVELVSMDNKIDYLQHLELPFFIGVVSQSPPAMRIYSAELLPMLFSQVGIPDRLSLLPVDESDFDKSHYFDQLEPGNIRLRCPLVVTLSTEDDRSALAPNVAALHAICTRARSNIATRLSEEHIYDLGGGGFQILAGRGSAKFFRSNFLKRLGEVFYNLYWILGNGPTDESWIAEFQIFETLYHSLERVYPGPLPMYVTVPYRALRQKLDQASR